MGEAGVPVNDLYSFTLPRLKELQRPVDVHFTSEGSRTLAVEVAGAIRNVLPNLGAAPDG